MGVRSHPHADFKHSYFREYLEQIMNDRFEPLSSGEVVSVEHDTQVLTGHRTFKVGELNDAIAGYLKSAISDWTEEKSRWLSQQGIDCEAFRFGSNGWQKGRIRLCLEFCPDEPTATDLSANVMTSVGAVNLPTSSITGTLPAPKAAAPAIQTEYPATINASTEANESPGFVVPSTLEIPVVNSSIDPVIPSTIGIATVGAVAAAVTTVVSSSTAPVHPVADVVLELENRHSDPNPDRDEELAEIAFDFDNSNDDRGRMQSSGMMELDLTDLGLDLSENDFLNFESNGLFDTPQEFVNLQDSDRPDNSGMLIDEVWNEMSHQPNWPSIN
jgi:KGK domain